MTIAIGSKVRCKPPFDQALPGIYTVASQDTDTLAWQIINDDGVLTDFAEANLEEVTG